MRIYRFWFAALVMSSLISGLVGTAARADDQAEIKGLEERLAAAISAKDLDRIMSFYAPDIFVFDVIPPRQYVGAEAYRKDFEGFLANFPGAVKFEVSDLAITADGKLGFAHYIVHMSATDKDGKPAEYNFRLTDCLRKVKGKWLIVHEHTSFPVDMATGKADMLSKP
jgi:uncharacterized protein (TIGR02246 family)